MLWQSSENIASVNKVVGGKCSGSAMCNGHDASPGTPESGVQEGGARAPPSTYSYGGRDQSPHKNAWKGDARCSREDSKQN